MTAIHFTKQSSLSFKAVSKVLKYKSKIENLADSINMAVQSIEKIKAAFRHKSL